MIRTPLHKVGERGLYATGLTLNTRLSVILRQIGGIKGQTAAKAAS
jgi:hypothetical protein